MNNLKFEASGSSNVVHLVGHQSEEVIITSQINSSGEKQNLLSFSNEKLLEIVSSDEALSRRRHDYAFLDLLSELFVFSSTQREALANDIKSEREELQFNNVLELKL